LHFVVLT